ncbi:hypothetical protein JWJ90_19610 [Desulfobulbus rhabdoformis]|uniref:hypothetical protein n=1 Tax=Desulfobulbus rhabdoformis TaxID=34032 RepID=UPI001965D493|nr:hypothetical protein [Desulfobulbus rhabdoformis]MBM9616477.1 hypothetical protein [Desulfobulbus rhabdoformis]
MPSIILSKIKWGVMLSLRKSMPALLLLLVASSPVLATGSWDHNYKFRPGLLSADSQWTPALSYDISLMKTLWSESENQAFRKSISAGVATNGTLAGDADLNNEPLLANARISTFINLYRPAIVSLGDKPGEYRTEKEGFNWGHLSFSLLAGYETDQALENRNLTGGAEVGYVLTENQGFKALVPSIFVGYDFVFNDHSDLEQTLGGEDDSRRVRLFASWKLPVGQWLSDSLDGLNAHVDLRYYKSDGLSQAYRDADKDEAVYTAGSLSYSFGDEPLWGVVNAVYVRLTDGRIPPVTNDDTTVMVGLTVWER